ncbi:hypothetical protein [Natrinema salaciae]|uniref:AI-2E family transporter n=1 Tax=Natrinema salaciae TaxID=1186196 RepID=A0A1H9FXU4_9EURY|nr:hypothetical protein [Natrinema salaciae]SEQ42318.1 hypothetical protein SAMN04489841_1701 [Natrinema salaciae]
MDETRIETRLNVIIALLLLILGYLVLGPTLRGLLFGSVSAILTPFAVAVLGPVTVLLAVWGLAKLSLALESA